MIRSPARRRRPRRPPVPPLRIAVVLATLMLLCGRVAAAPGPPHPIGDFEIPLVVHEARAAGVTGTTRESAVATFGIPLPRAWAVGEIDGRPLLGLTGTYRGQFRTLSRWPDGSVQWALVDAVTDVGADQIVDGIAVVPGSGRSPQPDLATDLGTHILLDTGPLAAAIRRDGFNLVDSLAVLGVVLIQPGTSPGIVGRTVEGEALVPGPGTKVAIEENGPARAVVRADGTLVTPELQRVVDFTCRIVFRAGSSDVELIFTLRNASLARPQHVVIGGVDLWLDVEPGAAPMARFARHDGEQAVPLDLVERAWLHQAYSDAPTTDLSGENSSYLPHIPKLGSLHLADEGYRIGTNLGTAFATANKYLYPQHGYADVTGSLGGVTVALHHMPYSWPASLEVTAGGLVGAGVFPTRNPWPYTFVWRQHESRRVLFSFHRGAGPSPAAKARDFDVPVSGRAADYGHYDRAGVFPYRLLTRTEQNDVYDAIGLDHLVTIPNESVNITRFLPAHAPGGANNHPSIERRLVGEWLRHGRGGQYIQALDLALYKAEWQILRSDDFHHLDDPGAQNDEIPHSANFQGDDEHRYRSGMVWAYYLTGDERLREALFDEEEILHDVHLWAHERSMYQTLRAQAVIAEFTHSSSLRDELKARLDYFLWPTIDVQTASRGWGWEAGPGTGSRRYFANSIQNGAEKPPGENFQARGFISASLGPIALYEAAYHLGPFEPQYGPARLRMEDLSYWTRQELYPWNPDPAARRLVYSYAISLQQYTSMQGSVFHPILLGMAESYRATGDIGYLLKGIEQLQNFKAVDQGPLADNMYVIDGRPDCQHFLAVLRDALAHQGLGAPSYLVCNSTFYGTGTGVTLSAPTVAQPGSTLRISVEGTPHADGVLAFSTEAVEAPIAGGTLWIDTARLLSTIPFHIDASGVAGIALELPAGPSLAGVPLYAQAGTFDPLALSGGLRLVLCTIP